MAELRPLKRDEKEQEGIKEEAVKMCRLWSCMLITEAHYVIGHNRRHSAAVGGGGRSSSALKAGSFARGDNWRQINEVWNSSRAPPCRLPPAIAAALICQQEPRKHQVAQLLGRPRSLNCEADGK